jgi:hypothetical protein
MPSRSRTCPGGPKRDPSDSRWLAACLGCGAVTPCFEATPEFRIIRLHTRYRRELTEERTRDKQRAEKLLESAAIKLSSVVSDLHGVTGRTSSRRPPLPADVRTQLLAARGPGLPCIWAVSSDVAEPDGLRWAEQSLHAISPKSWRALARTVKRAG